VTDKKNIEQLLAEMNDIELPKGYDERFYAKMEREENAFAWLKNIFSLESPELRWGLGLASLLVVSLSILKFKKYDDSVEQIAVNDEIDMLDDLDVLLEWDDQEENT
jgi:hypothetical protein